MKDEVEQFRKGGSVKVMRCNFREGLAVGTGPVGL